MPNTPAPAPAPAPRRRLLVAGRIPPKSSRLSARQHIDRCLAASHDGLLLHIRKTLRAHGRTFTEAPSGRTQAGWIYSAGDRSAPFAPLLVAHTDTVWGPDARPGAHRWVQNVARGTRKAEGIGADDRAGVAMLLYALQEGLIPRSVGLLFPDEEECGAHGTLAWVAAHGATVPEVYGCAIEVDRRGRGQAAVYHGSTSPAWEDWLMDALRPREDWTIQQGSFTDVAIIGRECSIPAVNLSAGYYKEHTPAESLDFSDWLHTFATLQRFLREHPSIFPPDDDGMGPGWNLAYHRTRERLSALESTWWPLDPDDDPEEGEEGPCDFCGDPMATLLTFRESSHLAGYTLCEGCLDIL